MQPTYRSPDTEHVERVEGSSEGWDTRLLTTPEAAQGTPIQRGFARPIVSGRRNNNLLALALIAIGVLVWLGGFIPSGGAITGGVVLLTIASAFLFFAFAKRIYGLLIPGSILGGLSLGVPFAELTNGMSVVWGLSLGFLAIYMLGSALFNMRNSWPLIPSVILFGVGVIIAVASLPSIFAAGFVWLPLLLVAAGLYLGFGRRGQ